MLRKTELVVLSSISGLDIEKCAQRLCEYKYPKHFGPIRVERSFKQEATPYLKKSIPEPADGYQEVDVLGLPLPELASVCEKSWTRMLEDVRNRPEPASMYAVATFHPVLYHQTTSEFAEPYLAGGLPRLVNSYRNEHATDVRWIVSIHDDVYDVYRKLMRPGRLFDPRLRGKKRNPQKDIVDLRMLLEWRDRELSAARAFASSIGARHLLFHCKGRTRTLGQIVFERKPCVYFSHSISQPRRDITGQTDESKCKTPDASRGEEMIKAIQAFSNRLAEDVAIVEPTAIDEHRLNLERLECLDQRDVAGAILPPLSKRWPIGEGTRLGGDASALNSENEIELLPLFMETLKVLRGLETTCDSLAGLRSSISLLQSEIERQINVRDHALVDQADLVIAFRPFSLPDSPEPTGGVNEEIATMRRKEAVAPGRCKPSVIIIHPKADELQRRGNAFDIVWDSEVEQHYEMPNEDLSNIKAECRRLIISTDNFNSASEIQKGFTELFKSHTLSVHPKTRKSSMPKGQLAQIQFAQRSFISAISEAPSIIKSLLQREAEASGGAIEFLEEVGFSERLSILIAKVLQHYSVESQGPGVVGVDAPDPADAASGGAGLGGP